MTAELYKLFLQMAIIGGITGILGFLSEKYQENSISIPIFNDLKKKNFLQITNLIKSIFIK